MYTKHKDTSNSVSHRYHHTYFRAIEFSARPKRCACFFFVPSHIKRNWGKFCFQAKFFCHKKDYNRAKKRVKKSSRKFDEKFNQHNCSAAKGTIRKNYISRNQTSSFHERFVFLSDLGSSILSTFQTKSTKTMILSRLE